MDTLSVVSDASVDALLPLPAAAFHILLALADGDRHGYAITQEIAARTGGDVRLGPGTLYRSIQRMLEQGLLVEPRRGRWMTTRAAAITASRRSAGRWRGPRRVA